MPGVDTTICPSGATTGSTGLGGLSSVVTVTAGTSAMRVPGAVDA